MAGLDTLQELRRDFARHGEVAAIIAFGGFISLLPPALFARRRVRAAERPRVASSELA